MSPGAACCTRGVEREEEREIMTKTLTPAVAYIRMSSGKQEASPAQQRATVRKV